MIKEMIQRHLVCTISEIIQFIVFGIVCVVVVISRKKDFFNKEVIKA